MKKILMIFLVGLMSHMAISQSLNEKDGKYYNTDGSLFTGIFQQKYDNGSVSMNAEVVAGYLHGTVNFYDEKGILTETGTYRSGQKDGLWLQYNLAGKKIGEARYADGKKDGIWTIWDDNGVKRYHMVYAMGKKVDVWKMWDENSQLVSERTY